MHLLVSKIYFIDIRLRIKKENKKKKEKTRDGFHHMAVIHWKLNAVGQEREKNRGENGDPHKNIRLFHFISLSEISRRYKSKTKKIGNPLAL